MIAITGNTYPVKDQLKALGARWNADARAWMVSPAKADEARAIVAGAPQQQKKSYGPSCWTCREFAGVAAGRP